MTDTEQESWLLNRRFIQDEDGYFSFMDYYLRLFALVNQSVVMYGSVSLSGGVSKDYIDRGLRNWVTSSGLGFGRGSYGTGRYGVYRTII